MTAPILIQHPRTARRQKYDEVITALQEQLAEREIVTITVTRVGDKIVGRKTRPVQK